MNIIRIVLIVAIILGGTSFFASAQQDDHTRISQLEQRVSKLDHDVRKAGDTGLVLVLFGAFCALWAQNTGRNAWLWFFLGLFFSVVTICFLLTKNANDRRAREQKARFAGGHA